VGILYWSKDIILVDLTRKLQEHDELQEVIEMVRTRRDCGVIVAFSCVDVAGCTTLTRLLTLRRVLLDRKQKLIPAMSLRQRRASSQSLDLMKYSTSSQMSSLLWLSFT